MCPGLIEASRADSTSSADMTGIIRGMCPGLIEALRHVGQVFISRRVLSGVCAPASLKLGVEVAGFVCGHQYYPGYVPRPH